MKTILHPANERGHADHGWLVSRHSFSFANYYDPHKNQFGALRVLNDDVVLGGRGFGTHPHDNMEIVSIPLSGALAHQDSTGRAEVIRTGDVQIMSAGTGIRHSEFNASPTEPVNFLQLWVLPKQIDIAPRYEQKTFDVAARMNRWQTVVAPTVGGSAVWINQDAYFNLANLQAGHTLAYSLQQAGQGLYLFVLSGWVQVGGQPLGPRDAMGISEAEAISITAQQDAALLLLELPMNY